MLFSLLIACTDEAPRQVLLPPVAAIWAAEHRHFDRDGDGVLGPREFTQGVRKHTSGLSFAAGDLDLDGRLSLSEFRTLMETREPRVLVDKRLDPGDPKRRQTEQFQFVPREGRIPGDEGPVATERKGLPNLLLISMDSVRADRTSPYGFVKDTTPWLARLAEHGVVFETVGSTGNESAYSHAAMLTGRYPSEIASPDYLTYQIPEEATLVGEILQLYGYETAAFLAGGHIRGEFGFDQGWQTFSHELGFASFWHTTPKALEWLDERERGAPWMLMVHGYDAHRSYILPDPYYHRFTAGGGSPLAEHIVRRGYRAERIYGDTFYEDFELESLQHPSGMFILTPGSYARLVDEAGARADGQTLTAADIEHLRGHYHAMLRYLDLQLALFLSAAEASGHLDNTLIVLTSDHGEDMLDHGWMNHRTGLTESCTRVPLVVLGPGVAEGARSEELVSLLDLVPTLLEAGGAVPPAELRGRSIWPALRGEDMPDQPIFYEGVNDQVAVRTATHKLVYSGLPLSDPGHLAGLQSDGPEHFALYDLRSDPGETAAVDDPAVFDALRMELIVWRVGLATATHGMDPASLDPAIRREMQDKGYWEFGED
ncbi:MAG TPA: sulfatase-like hydrolase/transferase [Myxococcota bacterium]|nr:sulfatase-like hydrolase/transferase [Myxococcota bacterium]